ncbi:MAG: hypothetical protein ACREKH_20525, partial [Candidatus Rokuibacteriota bacterium]
DLARRRLRPVRADSADRMTLQVARTRAVRAATLAHCESCGSEHLPPVPCGLTFKERIKTARFGSDWMPARQSARDDAGTYYDRSALDEAFGPDRREKMLEETRGLGPVQVDEDGEPWVFHDPDTREMRPMENSDIVGGFLRGSEPED